MYIQTVYALAPAHNSLCSVNDYFNFFPFILCTCTCMYCRLYMYVHVCLPLTWFAGATLCGEARDVCQQHHQCWRLPVLGEDIPVSGQDLH